MRPHNSIDIRKRADTHDEVDGGLANHLWFCLGRPFHGLKNSALFPTCT